MNLFSNTFNTLESALNYSSLKQKTISQNIANVDTPNYKAKDVSFKSMLQDSLDSMKAYRTSPKHIEFENGPGGTGGVFTKSNQEYNANGNSVDVDKEMSDLAENQLYYNAVAEILSGKFGSLQSVIKGGK
ncbi:flagellar basal body rod protein FlgB [Peribacillus kribbensis]|uniref:flagellar basal body rod protein FlgB n=1 Tax=Peribacillus kribbensis TaxID=356658 RepID=UPI0003FF46E1|nr:flagellar basal body rod protein FlgB [Peribacillus kribbensis]